MYSGTKFFIEGMSQALRQELVEYGIKVTTVQPGDVATELANRSTDQEVTVRAPCCGEQLECLALLMISLFLNSGGKCLPHLLELGN